MQSRWLRKPGCPETAAFARYPVSCARSLAILAFWFFSLCSFTVFDARAAGESLELRNSSPLAQLYGLPSMRGARAEGWRARFSVDVANSFTGDIGSSEFVFLDGETATFSYTVRRDFGDRWEAGVEVPWVTHSGGRFDGLIDDFHDLFGLPDGGRPLAERGEIDYLVRTDGAQQLELREKTTDLGDVRSWLALGIYESPERALVGRLHLKLPTGRTGTLSGSGALDVAFGADYVDGLLLSKLGVQLTLGGGLARLGKGDLIPERQETWVPYGHLGLSVGVGEHKRLRLLGQLDAHGALFDAQLSQLGHSVLQGTLGLQFAPTPKLALELSLIEDLSGALASDAIFRLSVTGRL